MSARNTYDFKSQGNQPKAQIFLNFKMANKNLFEKSAEHSYCYFLLSNFFAGKASGKKPITMNTTYLGITALDKGIF